MKSAKEFESLTRNKEVMRAAFGDHAQIIARRNGTFDVDEYEHD